MAVTIRALSTGAELKQFIKLQWKFYKNDPNWVPPLFYDRKKTLDTKKNPFFQHSEIQLFIAEKDGVPVGRIAALTNQNHNDAHSDAVGFFGFFESIDDQLVANALFTAAADWLRSRGKDTMRGPMNPSVNDEIGLLVEGFDNPPQILMTYNPPYYLGLLYEFGLRKVKDLHAYLLTRDSVLTPKLERGQELVRQRYNIRVRDVDFKNIKQEVRILKDLYNRGWEKNWGAIAMTDAEFDFLASDLTQVLGNFREFAFVVEKDGEPVGFSLTLPDINQILITNRRGWLLPAAFKLKTQSNKINRMRMIVLGLVPEYRKRGLDAILYYEVIQRGMKRGIATAEASWILEDNVMINRAMEMMNATPYKRYRIYDYPL
jgi:hypothetical protein